MNEFWENIKNMATGMGLKIVFALLILIVGIKLSNVLIKKFRKSKGYQKIDSSVAGFIASFISIALKVIIVIIAISILGVPMSSIVALIASAGVAVGLAAQGAMANLVGGIMILVFKPFRKGEYIETESVSGTVKGITVFYTILTTPDNKTVTIPNGGLTNSIVTNCSSEKNRRVDLTFSVDYKADSEKVKSLLLNAASETEFVLKEPAPAVFMVEQGESAIKYSLRLWVENEHYWDVKFAMTEKAKKIFDENNINIPYPQMDVHIKEVSQKQ